MATTNVLEQRFKLKDVLERIKLKNQMEEGRKNAAAAEQTSYSSDSDDSFYDAMDDLDPAPKTTQVQKFLSKIPALKKAAAPKPLRRPLDDERGRKGPVPGRKIMAAGDVTSLEEMVRRNMNLVTAEELLKASVVSDRADWISFNYNSDSDTNIQQFEEWLESNRPSLIKSASGIGWISVSLPFGRGKGYKVEREDMVEEARAEWEACPSKTNAAINSLAKRMEITSGKWLVHVQPEEVDATWNKIAHSVVARKFGPTVLSAKVSPSPEELDVRVINGPPKHVICIYNKDYTDIKQVLTVEKEIRRLGIAERISYKPDIYSLLGIYRNNKYGLRPTIYTSSYNKMNRETVFQSLVGNENFKIKH